jgi:hypothetical protein
MSSWKYRYMFTWTLQGCEFCPGACQQYFVYRRNFNCPHESVYRVGGTLYSNLGREGTGVSDFVMYRTASTHLRGL